HPGLRAHRARDRAPGARVDDRRPRTHARAARPGGGRHHDRQHRRPARRARGARPVAPGPAGGRGVKVTAPAAADPHLRREQRGWYWYDWATSAFNTTVITVFLGPYLTSVAEAAAGPDGFVGFFGLDLRAKAYFSGIVTISVLLQIVVMPLTGAIADHTGRKRELLGVFAYVGALATLGFYFVSGDAYLLGGVLFVIANVCFGAATVVYNSFLPQISSAETRDTVSSRGWAFGYLGEI